MAQKCVFCGGTPQNKNKEHVIPQWLSKYLGRYNSVCDLSGVTDLQIPFKGLTFPACEKCNSADSALEAAAKDVVEKMMSAQPVTGLEINTLLDWFDKLRIGIWLGQLMLSKKIDTIVPNFYINDRIALKDRMLIIEHVEGVGKGLGLVGSNNNMFQYSPNAFQVWFNDVLITSVSSTGLVGNKLGFPVVGKISGLGESVCYMKISKGRNKTTHPVVMNIDATDKTVIYQPIFKEYTNHECYNVPYVLKHCYDYKTGLGGIFVQRNNNTIRYMMPDDKVNLIPKLQPNASALSSIKRVFELQNHIVTGLHKTNVPDTLTAAKIQTCMLENQMLIQACQKMK